MSFLFQYIPISKSTRFACRFSPFPSPPFGKPPSPPRKHCPPKRGDALHPRLSPRGLDAHARRERPGPSAASRRQGGSGDPQVEPSGSAGSRAARHRRCRSH
nr:uncharacterized protein LOC103246674 [Chlorocebus sabaeus]